MDESLQVVVTAILTGIGMGAGIAIGTYFANKALIQNLERLIEAVRNNKEGNKKNKT